ncbi:MAG: glycosyltransferase [Phycisphaerales bacterium]|nr:glycosyltransferase [Phycisphaerales bacterium]
MNSWCLCIPTLNRPDVLVKSVRQAVQQTRPPGQIVIVDASDDWESTCQKIQELIPDSLSIELRYVPCNIRSSTTQRNLGTDNCTQDVIFFFDDDAYMHHDCAEKIMSIYDADHEKKVAGIAGKHISQDPTAQDSSNIASKNQVGQSRNIQTYLVSKFRKSFFGRWFMNKVLFHSMGDLFIMYDEPRARDIPQELKGFGVTPAPFLHGFAMTVRKEIAIKEPFEPMLRYYAAFEDLDASYRYAKHGLLLNSNNATVHHFEAAGGRIKRKTVIVFQLLNMLVFLKKNASQPNQWTRRYKWMLRRRLFGEFIKDTMTRRFSYPQASGVFFVMRRWRKVWNKDAPELTDWYPQFQKEILERNIR